MVFHFYRGNLRGGLFFHAQAEDQCKNAGMQNIYLQLFQSSLEVISYVMHKMLIKCMLIDHIHISRLKFEYKISKSCLQDKVKHNVCSCTGC